MSYARLSKRTLLCRSFTGLEISEFDAMYVYNIESGYSEYKGKFLEGVRLAIPKRFSFVITQ
jgi:hypothetical protein